MSSSGRKPKTSLRDFRVKSTLDDSYRNGIFELETDLSATTCPCAFHAEVSFELLDPVGKVVASETKPVAVQSHGEKNRPLQRATAA
jgi:beta-galactosidase